MQDVAVLEIARFAHVVDARQESRRVGVEQRGDLGRGPKVERAFLPLRVGVAGGMEGAVGRGEILEHVVQRLLGDGAEVAGAEQVRAGHRTGDERVVVQHLLEVRNQPARIDRVPVEASAGVVADAAGRHAIECVRRHRHPVRSRAAGPEQEVEEDRLGKLGRPAEAPVCGIEAAPDGGHGVLEEPGIRRTGVSAFGVRLRCASGQHVLEPGARASHLVAPVCVGVGGRGEDLPKGRHAVARLRRVVGAPVERHALGSEERGQRPASVPGDRLHRAHVDGVDVRPLLPVDLDVDEVRVHHAGRFRVLERLALHDVAPVASRVPDREEDGTVLPAGQRQRLFTPGKPVHGVVCVLQEVGRGLVFEAVWHGTWDRVVLSAVGVVHGCRLIVSVFRGG